jgi:uncharacterized small protein (DUF1192 family)
MDIDLDRWQALRAAYANAVDASPPFMLLQEAQGRWSRANADLEDFKARGAVGRRDQRNPDIELSFKRSVAELEQRVAEAEREVKRLDALQRQSSARRNTQGELVDGVKAWAKKHSISLPGDDAVTITGMTGFGAAAVRMPTPSSGREFAPSVAPRQGGTTAAAEPPTPRVQRGTSGVVRTMSRVWP